MFTFFSCSFNISWPCFSGPAFLEKKNQNDYFILYIEKGTFKVMCEVDYRSIHRMSNVQGSPFKFTHMLTLKQNQDNDKVASKHPEDKKCHFNVILE